MQCERTRREAKLDALHERLAQAVDALVSGDDWRRSLEFAARFRSRSFNNTLLIAAQHLAAFDQGKVPDPIPTYVAGFQQWHRLDRHVVKGQAGYQILAPVTARFATTAADAPARRLGHGQRPQPGETVQTRMIGLRPAHVWDVSQTEGAPIPEPPRPRLLTGDAPMGLWEGLAESLTSRGYGVRLVSSASSIGGANGLTDFHTHEVSIRMDMDESAQVKTMAHELGHVMLHDPDNADAALHRGVAEVEAESFALMIAAAHGLDTTSFTVPYVASWATTVSGQTARETVQLAAQRVRGAAVTVLDSLNTSQVGSGDPPGLGRTSLATAPEFVPVKPVTWLDPSGVRL